MLFVIQEGLFGEVVRTPGTGIELGHLGVTTAVARQSSKAMKIPIHIAGAVIPVVAWMRIVSHRKAPGAISAMAFMVKPVRPSVGFISVVLF